MIVSEVFGHTLCILKIIEVVSSKTSIDLIESSQNPWIMSLKMDKTHTHV